jgi:hypothetical protein
VVSVGISRDERNQPVHYNRIFDCDICSVAPVLMTMLFPRALSTMSIDARRYLDAAAT